MKAARKRKPGKSVHAAMPLGGVGCSEGVASVVCVEYGRGRALDGEHLRRTLVPEDVTCRSCRPVLFASPQLANRMRALAREASTAAA
jgi:hypothetical protein